MEIKDLAGISKPLEKLIVTISKGLGCLFTAYITKRNTTAHLQAMEDFTEVIAKSPVPIKEAEYQGNGFVVKFSSDGEILNRAKSREEFKSIKKQCNIESIISQTADELNKDEAISAEEVEEDWITRYFNIIEDISDEQMQNIWAKVLAGEIRKPKSYSLRTLELLKNLSKEEANLFNTISAYAININNQFCLLNTNELLSLAKELTYTDIINLKDSGLISNSEALCSIDFSERNSCTLINCKKLIIIEASQESSKIQLSILPFTKAGTELLAFTNPTSNNEYIMKLCNLVKASKARIHVADIEKIVGDKISYKNKNVISG
ncbi:hypothetical protein Lqui_2128 [Legionella quinlivanii]|uniref:DUF2806 domain-containing protein n=1 Tax=Legionella quinlivanii TaxID=45073 RepID=A0A0W0XUJ5_9GAMM|nr:DUF2806 domain-containing protein [Legionella quinlivanii]KTD48086.1 hypothetical protein Lqui_2128 [Legionella quinlivanii]SEG48673.1 TIGR03899 family protein [Legionella quinlivanii DSM 21216]STY49780.1 Protein of uncharacterised function (DUF2806) [Legionella quinlivanii]